MNKLAVLIIVLLIAAIAYYVYASKYGKQEVYLISANTGGAYTTSFASALALAQTFDPSAQLATRDQLNAAQAAGAQWCSFGFLSDGTIGYPMQVNATGCGPIGVTVGPSFGTNLFNVTVYGIKPTQAQVTANGKVSVLPFIAPATWSGDTKPMKWSQHDS